MNRYSFFSFLLVFNCSVAFANRCEDIFKVDAGSRVLQQRLASPLFRTGFDSVKIQSRLSRIDVERIFSSYPENGLRIAADFEMLKNGVSANDELKKDSRFRKISDIVDEMTVTFAKLLPPGYSLRPEMIQILLQKPDDTSWNPLFHVELGNGLASFFTAYGNRTTRYVRSDYLRKVTEPVPADFEGALLNPTAPRSWLRKDHIPKLIFPRNRVEHAKPGEALVFFGTETAENFPSEWTSAAKPLLHASPNFEAESLNDYRIGLGLSFAIIKNDSNLK